MLLSQAWETYESDKRIEGFSRALPRCDTLLSEFQTVPALTKAFIRTN
nr:hypothetical protein [Bacillus sp. X1(2014)]